jgi:hypothetical protein
MRAIVLEDKRQGGVLGGKNRRTRPIFLAYLADFSFFASVRPAALPVRMLAHFANTGVVNWFGQSAR